MNHRRRIGHAIALLGLVAGALLMVWAAAEEMRRPWLVVGGFFSSGCLVGFWWLCQGKKSVALRSVLIVGLLLRAIFFPLGGELSDDYHRYLWDGALVREGINPFQQLPSEMAAAEHRFVEANDHRHWLKEMNSPDYYSIYPPVSQLSFAIAGTGGYWGLKILFALAELGVLLLLARIVNARRLILYAWNPLLILETWGQPHTEALALLGLALALWAWTRRRNALVATTGIVLAAWVKLFPVLLLPFLWRRLEHRRSRWCCALFAAGLSVLLWLPFLSVETFSNLFQSSHLYMLSFEFNAGPYYAIKWLTTTPLRALGWLGKNQDTSKVVGPLMRAVFFCGLFWLWRSKGKSPRDFPKDLSAFVALFLITFVNLHPWYLSFAVLAMPWMSARMCLAWLWLGACSLGTYLTYTHDVYWPFVIVGWTGFAALLLLARPLDAGLSPKATTPRSTT